MSLRLLVAGLSGLLALACGFTPPAGRFRCPDGECPDGQFCDESEVCQSGSGDFGVDAGLDLGPADDGPLDLGPLDLGMPDRGPPDLGIDPACLDPGTTRDPPVDFLAADGAPDSQGWTEAFTRMGSGRLIADDRGEPAWEANGIDGLASWQIGWPLVIDRGWRLELELRVDSGTAIDNYFTDATRRFLPTLSLEGTSGAQELVVAFEGGGTHTLATGEDALAYHTHVMVFDVESGTAMYYFDGLCIEEMEVWSGSDGSQLAPTIIFGNGSSGREGDGVAFYRRVEFTPNP